MSWIATAALPAVGEFPSHADGNSPTPDGARPVRARPGRGLDFELPAELEADRPPEARGLRRDEVRLLVARRGAGDAPELEHARFRDLPSLLAPGDLLVVNTSATIPAAVPARLGGRPVEVRFSTAAPETDGGEWWIVELRSADGLRPHRGRAAAGDGLELPQGARVELVAPYRGTRLWLARLGGVRDGLHAYLARNGAPIRYRHAGAWPLDAHQTVFALEPGSAEMPSAARPFTTGLVSRLVAAGIGIAPITLHTGVSSPELDEPPYPERFSVPASTARAVNAAGKAGSRVIAVGTTVARALETAAGDGRSVAASKGWTDLVITPERDLRAIDGLISGWHEPHASHLELLEAVAGRRLLERSYEEALAAGYLWHEFGDSHLILPRQQSGPVPT